MESLGTFGIAINHSSATRAGYFWVSAKFSNSFFLVLTVIPFNRALLAVRPTRNTSILGLAQTKIVKWCHAVLASHHSYSTTISAVERTYANHVLSNGSLKWRCRDPNVFIDCYPYIPSTLYELTFDRPRDKFV